jgi:hypothetical protein
MLHPICQTSEFPWFIIRHSTIEDEQPNVTALVQELVALIGNVNVTVLWLNHNVSLLNLNELKRM